MNVFRCLGLSIIVLLGACDAQETPVPKPKTEASFPVPTPAPAAAPASIEARDAAVTPPPDTVLDTSQVKTPANVHELMPGVPVVPVVVGKEKAAPVMAQAKSASGAGDVSSSKAAAKGGASKEGAAKAPAGKRELAKNNGKSAKATNSKDLRRPKLDLSLPPELVKELEPPSNVITAKRKPLLPPMFSTKDAASDPSAFELNGRLLSNEMQLQMRNESRRDVEGAALDFKFKQ